jgi:hypothetical protein
MDLVTKVKFRICDLEKDDPSITDNSNRPPSVKETCRKVKVTVNNFSVRKQPGFIPPLETVYAMNRQGLSCLKINRLLFKYT